MNRRPERLRATKLYAPNQTRDNNGQTEIHSTKQANPQQNEKVNPTTTKTLKQNFKSIAPRRNSVSDNGIKSTTKLNAIAGKGNQLPMAQEQPKRNDKSKSETVTHEKVITQKVTEEKFNKKNEIRKPDDLNTKKSVITNGIVKGTETTNKNAKSLENDKLSMAKSGELKNTHKELEGDTNSNALKDNVTGSAVTRKDVKATIRQTMTNTTKVSSAYKQGNPQTNSQVTQQETGLQQHIPDSKTKHFSKLENKTKETLKQETENNQHETRSNDIKKRRSDMKINKATQVDKLTKPVNKILDNKPKDQQQKFDRNAITKGTSRDKVETDNTSASSKLTKVNVTPRMTSTAIAKPPRNQALNGSSKGKLVSLTILIMNVSGKDDKGGTPPERRKHAIQNVITKHKPNLVLFQEFTWPGISGKPWAKYPLPENFVYKGDQPASIMFDAKCIQIQDLPAADIDTILKGLHSNSNNRLKRAFPKDFNPISSMYITRVSSLTKPMLDFICISWHGRSIETGGVRKKELKKIEYFEYWMEFLRNIREKYKLPILAGGDYNVDMYSIEHCVQSPFNLCIYEASMRRTVRGIIDFYIITEDLQLSDIAWINLERDTTVFHPNSILDHDPIIGSLMESPLTMKDAAMGAGKKKAWPSPIAKNK